MSQGGTGGLVRSQSGTGGKPGGGGGAAGSQEPPHPAIEAGRDHNCVRFADGRLKCWGSNGGWLGLGDYENRGDDPDEMGRYLPFVGVASDATVETISVGESHTCATLSDRRLKCWGNNSSGELGIGDTMNRGIQPGQMSDNLPRVDLGTERFAIQVATGMGHTCALLDNGWVKCWGWNQFGQLGLGDTECRGCAPDQMGDALPAVDLGRLARAITAGGDHSCALLDDGSVKCWGGNSYAELGLGDTSSRGDAPGEMGDALPRVDLGTGRTAVAIAAGSFHNCALLDGDEVKCWGWNAAGMLGLGDHRDRGGLPNEMGDQLPSVSLGTESVPVLVTTGGYHTCVLLRDGSVKCWGDGTYGALGLGDGSPRGGESGQMGDALPTVNLGTDRRALSVTAGYHHNCVVLDDDSVKCWGWNNLGQLGLGDTVDRGGSPDQMGDALPAVELF